MDSGLTYRHRVISQNYINDLSTMKQKSKTDKNLSMQHGVSQLLVKDESRKKS